MNARQIQRIEHLPTPPPDKTGWPWTEASPPLPAAMPDGSPWPRITVVTPSFNQGQYIEETIRSILLQGYPNLEYIIIDGGSTDHSVEIIRQYEPWLTYWVSEPDQGQAHAINKGLARATGEIFNWINSDDYLTPNALESIACAMGDSDLLAGSVRNFYEGMGEEEVFHHSRLSVNDPRQIASFTFHQPGIWLRPKLILAAGGIDETFHHGFDGDLMLRYLYLYPNVQYVEVRLANFRFHQKSKTTISRLGEDRFFYDHMRTLGKIIGDPRFIGLHAFCRVRLCELNWIALVGQIRKDPTLSVGQRRYKILSLALRNPIQRLNRFTLGSLKHC